MSLEFNVGELVTRVRRALAVRGRMPFDLDERAAVQLNVMDLDKAPWRSDGAAWATLATQAASPANNSRVFIGPITGALGPPVGARCVIQQLQITNSNGAAITVQWGVPGTGINPGGNLAISLEKSVQSGGLTTVGVVGVSQAASATAVQQVTNAIALGNLIIPPTSSVVIGVELTLFGQGPALCVETAQLNVNLTVVAVGVLWNGEGFQNT